MDGKALSALEVFFRNNSKLRQECEKGFISPTLFKNVMFAYGTGDVESAAVPGVEYRFRLMSIQTGTDVILIKIGSLWIRNNKHAYSLSSTDGGLTQVKPRE